MNQKDQARLEELFRCFGNARRRAYTLKQHGVPKAEIERLLQEQTGLNSRYAKDAHHFIENLPPHVTFGGLKLQRLREQGRISCEEYKKRRNSLIISRGDKTKKGNLNTRITKEGNKLTLRITTPTTTCDSGERWIHPQIFIPEKYLKGYQHLLLDGKSPYTVVLKRRDNDRGYDVRITVEPPGAEEEEAGQTLKPKTKPERVMTLDVNAGHVDFAVAEKNRVLAVGRINCHEVQYASTNKTNHLLHKTASKVRNIAEHYYCARVVYGKLNTQSFRSKYHRANRKVKRIPHRKLGSILEAKCGAVERSEAYTTKLGLKLSPKVGLDVHKCAAASFALKVLDYESFKTLRSSSLLDENNCFPRGVASDEGVGSLRRRLSVGSGLTALHQDQGLVHDEVACDLKIGIGGIVPHPQFGFGGGAKIVLPGISSIRTISFNHGDLGGWSAAQNFRDLHPTCQLAYGRLNAENILRQDSEEATRMAGMDMVVNVLFDFKRNSTDIFAGDVVEAQRKGVEEAMTHYRTQIPLAPEIVISNAYSKASEAAIASWPSVAMKEGGTLVIVCNTPTGQVSHYVHGRWGINRVGGNLWLPPPGILNRMGKIIILSQYPEKQPWLEMAPPEKTINLRTWEDTIEELKNTHEGKPRVAVFPDSTLQKPF